MSKTIIGMVVVKYNNIKPDTTYEIEEAELVEDFRSGIMSLEEFEEALAALRKNWGKEL